jgi:parvulin-like peptidyl-prolyl isomerase
MRYSCSILILCWALAAARSAETVNFIEAIVNDAVITHQQVEQYSALSLEGLYYNPYVKAKDRQKEASLILSNALDELMASQFILNDYNTGNLKLPQAVIDDEADRRLRKRFGDRVALSKKLKEWGMSYETLRKQYQDGFVIEVMTSKNVASGVLVSPQKIEQYYLTNQAKYHLGEEVERRVIILPRPEDAPVEPLRARVLEVSAIIDSGASFAEMASIYSSGPTRQAGGYWGWYETAKMPKGMADILTPMKPGEHSPVLGKTIERASGDPYWMYQYAKDGSIACARKYRYDKASDTEEILEEKKAEGTNVVTAPVPPDEFYIVQLMNRRPARVELLADVRDQIEKDLKLREQERLRKAWIERLRKKTFWRFFS